MMMSLPGKKKEWCNWQKTPGYEESKGAPQIKSADCSQNAHWTKRCTSLSGVGQTGQHFGSLTMTRSSS